jgi:hypothetical protein
VCVGCCGGNAGFVTVVVVACCNGRSRLTGSCSPSSTPPRNHQVRELLSSFGTIRILELIKDKETGNSKG